MRSARLSASSCATRLPADCKVEFMEHGSGRAIRFPIEAPAFAKTQQALTAEWGQRRCSSVAAARSRSPTS